MTQAQSGRAVARAAGGVARAVARRGFLARSRKRARELRSLRNTRPPQAAPQPPPEEFPHCPGDLAIGAGTEARQLSLKRGDHH